MSGTVWSAADFRQLLHKARPAFEPILKDLLAHRVCVRCCLRLASVRSFGADLHILERQPLPAPQLIRALQVPPDQQPAEPAGHQQAGPAADSQPTPSAEPPADPVPQEQANGHAAAAAAEAVLTAQPPDITAEDSVCSLCTGILQTPEGRLTGAPSSAVLQAAIAKLALQPDALHQPSGSPAAVADSIRALGYDGDTFALELCIPAVTSVRDVAMLRHLAKAHSGASRRHQNTLDLKDALRMALARPLAAAAGLRLDQASDLRVCLAYASPCTAEEADFLTDKGQGSSRKRKRSQPAAAVGRAASAQTWSLLEAWDPEKPFPSVASPPGPCAEPPLLLLSVKRASLYVGGWYTKLNRDVSNSPFFIDGKRLGVTSVEEEIARFLLPAFRCDGHKFNSAGREDMDVRMLGAGRPFSLEVINARISQHSADFFRSVEQQLDQADCGVKVHSLQLLDKQQLAAMKAGETAKQKSYTALCWLPVPVTDAVVAALTSEQELVLTQTTPTRVAHRRALLDRRRSVYSMRCEPVPGEPQQCTLRLRTQAGTYIKEFVHGDEGRTQPNVSSLLGASEASKCLLLDVEQIHMEWP